MEAELIGPNGNTYTIPSYSSNVPALYDRSGLYGPDLGMPVPAYYDHNVLYGPDFGAIEISTGSLFLLLAGAALVGGAYWYMTRGPKRRKARR